MAVCNLACEGLTGTSSNLDLTQRKLYIGGLSPNVTSEMLLHFFGRHGDIEEGSVAYDKDTNESRYDKICHIQYVENNILYPFHNSFAVTCAIVFFSFCVVGLALLHSRQWRLQRRP